MTETIVEKNIRMMVSGKRKAAVAKALISSGSGKVTINKIPYENLSSEFHVLLIREPLEIAKKTLGSLDADIRVNLAGGGTESRIEAARLAIAKALVKFTKSSELKKAFLEYDRNMLVADTRRKEPYKPGDSKARAKRQKSYR
jgi:small subunit ribosomal protein S9